MYGIDAPIRERRIESFDGTRVTYYVAGEGRARMVLAPGLGTPFVAWKHIIEEFQDLYSIVTWDPRGTYRSDAPADPEALRVEDHVRDFAAIRAAEGLERFVLGGWSMGVQIALEHYHRHPETVRALALINGAYEHVLATAFGLPGANQLFSAILHAGRRVSPVFGPVASFLLTLDATTRVLHATRLVSNHTPLFKRMMEEFSQLDWKTYFKMILLLNEHSAEPYLGDVTVPTLVTAGTHDRMTPVATADKLHRAIGGSELFVVHHGTHYTMAEYPEVLNLRLERFLRSVDPELFHSRGPRSDASFRP